MKKFIFLEKMMLFMFLGIFMFCGVNDATGQRIRLPVDAGSGVNDGVDGLLCVSKYHGKDVGLKIMNLSAQGLTPFPKGVPTHSNMKIMKISFASTIIAPGNSTPKKYYPTNTPLNVSNNIIPYGGSLNGYNILHLNYNFDQNTWVDIINNETVITQNSAGEDVMILTLAVNIDYKNKVNNVWGDTQFETIWVTWKVCNEATPPPTSNRKAQDYISPQLEVNPNPVNEEFTMSYDLAETSTVSGAIYNVLGQEVKSIIATETQYEGKHEKTISVSDLDKGIYYVILRIGKNTITKKFVKL